jgi:glycosyltransferase involved in cell wall biosynthesis
MPATTCRSRYTREHDERIARDLVLDVVEVVLAQRARARIRWGWGGLQLGDGRCQRVASIQVRTAEAFANSSPHAVALPHMRGGRQNSARRHDSDALICAEQPRKLRQTRERTVRTFFAACTHDMARIVWLSDAPSRTSGFGLVTREVCERLARMGHEIVILGWWSSAPTTYHGMMVTPCSPEPTAAARLITQFVAEWRPDFLVTLADVPWISYIGSEAVQEVLWRSNTRWCLYYPVDATLPDGALPSQWAVVLSKVDLPVTMSAFGVAASARCGITAALIPHGCGVDLFRPPSSKRAAKQRFGYDGKFVILSDVRNHRRKLIPRALDVIQTLKIPRDRVIFHLHTLATPQEDADSYRYDVQADVELLELGVVRGVRDGVGVSDVSMFDLADLYAAADVHLLTSFGEGFGLPTLQAASAGVVPIVPANSASRELVGNHGFAVRCDSWTTDEFGLLRGFIDRQQAASLLERLYADSDLLRARSLAARRFALNFTWDRVATQWNECLREGAAFRRRSAPNVTSVAGGEARCIVPSPQSSSLRPSGHEASVLPMPRIGLPTRLQVTSRHARTSTPIVLAETSCVGALLVLERLFPGTCVLDPACADSGQWIPERLIKVAALVVDPHGRLAGIDEICAVRGASFLGTSRIWPKVPGGSLLAQARLLLTDFPLAEQRMAIARERLGVQLR